MKNRLEVREDHAVIFLDRKDGSSLEAKVGLYDLARLSTFKGKWCAMYSEDNDSFYAYGKEGTKSVMMHRFLMDAGKSHVVDHYNHDTLDNRRIENLRLATRSQNSQNRKGAQGKQRLVCEEFTFTVKQGNLLHGCS